MKGYFSKLAKQSGLHYAKGNTASPYSDAKKRAEEIEPLHREEIFLVSPVAAKNETPEAVENLSPQTTDSAVKNSGELSGNESFKPFLPPEKFDAANREGVFGQTKQSKTFVEPQPIEPEKRNSAESRAVEQIIILKENEPAEMIAGESAEAASPQDFHPAESPVKSEDETIEVKSAPPEYFNKTAEILESGTADKSEVQKILLQEINEWVSAVPALSETENEFESEREAQSILPPIGKDTSIRYKSTENPSESVENLQEQNFDLSIGTITVVVEEPDNQIQIAAKNQSRITEKPEPEKRGSSRLSRYYL